MVLIVMAVFIEPLKYCVPPTTPEIKTLIGLIWDIAQPCRQSPLSKSLSMTIFSICYFNFFAGIKYQLYNGPH
jgi:hypothetical protein